MCFFINSVINNCICDIIILYLLHKINSKCFKLYKSKIMVWLIFLARKTSLTDSIDIRNYSKWLWITIHRITGLRVNSSERRVKRTRDIWSWKLALMREGNGKYCLYKLLINPKHRNTKTCGIINRNMFNTRFCT